MTIVYDINVTEGPTYDLALTGDPIYELTGTSVIGPQGPAAGDIDGGTPFSIPALVGVIDGGTI